MGIWVWNLFSECFSWMYHGYFPARNGSISRMPQNLLRPLKWFFETFLFFFETYLHALIFETKCVKMWGTNGNFWHFKNYQILFMSECNNCCTKFSHLTNFLLTCPDIWDKVHQKVRHEWQTLAFDKLSNTLWCCPPCNVPGIFCPKLHLA